MDGKQFGLAKLITKIATSFLLMADQEVDEGINLGLAQIGEFVGVDRSYVFLYSPDGQEMTNLYEWCAPGVTPYIDQLQKIPLDTYPWFNQQIREKEFVLVNDMESLSPEAIKVQEEWEREGIKSIVCLPMRVNQILLGFVGFDFVQENKHFAEREVALLELVGGLFAKTLYRKWTDQAQRVRVEELSVLSALSNAVNAAKNVEELMVGSIDIIGDMLFPDNFGIVLRIEESPDLTAWFKGRDHRISKGNFSEDTGVIGRVLASGKSELIPDVSKDQDYLSFKVVMGSEVCVPIMIGDQVVGAINAESKELDYFTKSNLALLDVFSRHLSMAVEKIWLFEKYQDLAATDSLTGINNRRHFFNLAEKEFAAAKRYHSNLAAIMMDVDGFKKVNDTYGHFVGDQILIQVAEILQIGVRGTDILARYGGDEFVILLTNCDLHSAENLSNRIRDMIKAHEFTNVNGNLKVTISQGLAELTEDISELDQFIERADQALLCVKKNNKDAIQIWNPEIGLDKKIVNH